MLVDLTMPLDERTPVYAGDPKVEIAPLATLEREGWIAKRLHLHTHVGTHIDAPAHMIKGGKSLGKFPPDTFIADAVVIDVRGQKEIDCDISTVRHNDIVFFYTGYSEKAYSANYFSDNPVISTNVAKELIKKKVKIVGIDSFSPDNEPFEVHKILLAQNILIVENLINLGKLNRKRVKCFVMPLPLDADGAPCRVIAIY